MRTLKPLAVIAVFATSTALAQSRPDHNQPSRDPVPPPTAAESSPSSDTLTIEFPGGTVGQYVQAIRQSSPLPINIVLPPHAAKVEMAAVSLKAVSPLDATNAILAVADIPENESWTIRKLSEIGGSNGQVIMAPSPSDRELSFVVLTSNWNRTVTMGPTGRPITSSINAPHTAIFSIRDLIDSGLTPDTIVTAIDTALHMDKDTSSDPEIKFHEESGLLIVRANPEQLSAATQVIAALKETAAISARVHAEENRVKQMTQLSHQIASLYSEADEIKSDYYARKEHANVAQRAVATLEARNDTPVEQLAKAREDAASAQHDVVAVGFRVDRTEREIHAAEANLAQLRTMSPDNGPQSDIARLRAENEDLRARLDKLEEKKAH